jgi:hypothetical protein
MSEDTCHGMPVDRPPAATPGLPSQAGARPRHHERHLLRAADELSVERSQHPLNGHTQSEMPEVRRAACSVPRPRPLTERPRIYEFIGLSGSTMSRFAAVPN